MRLMISLATDQCLTLSKQGRGFRCGQTWQARAVTWCLGDGDRAAQAIDAERRILGAILLDNNALNALIEKLNAQDFHDRHRRIYQQMIVLD